MKILVLTSTCLRHKFFAKSIIKKCQEIGYEVSCVFESKEYDTLNSEYKELCFYDEDLEIDDQHVLLTCVQGKINSRKVIDSINQYSPDVGLVFGTSILKKNVFELPANGCYNIHTGLVQYYRGVDSVVWPLVHKEYEKIGFTIHKVSAGIDDGQVVLQKQISAKNFYDPYNMFLDVCKEGTKTLVENFSTICNNTIKASKIKPSGKLYRKKDAFENMEKVARQNLYEFNAK